MTDLFSSFSLKDIMLRNRIAVSPMCQYHAVDGFINNWHSAHYSMLARGGAVAGIQLAHAGRKTGFTPPWQGGAPLDRDDAQAWELVGPSAVPFLPGNDYIPREMTKDNIRQMQQDFARAAERACQAGFQWLELHFAHGFLAQSFLSRSQIPVRMNMAVLLKGVPASYWRQWLKSASSGLIISP